MTLDEHIITIVGPKHEIDRFAEDFKLVSGAIDTDTGGIVRGWNQVPSMRAEPGWRYRVRKCRVGLCDIEIELDVQYPGTDAMVAVYRTWTTAYPGLRFIWRYWKEMSGAGYIDEDGEHQFREIEGDEDGDKDAGESTMTTVARSLARAAMLCEWATDGLVPSEDWQPFHTVRQECEAALALMGHSASEFGSYSDQDFCEAWEDI